MTSGDIQANPIPTQGEILKRIIMRFVFARNRRVGFCVEDSVAICWAEGRISVRVLFSMEANTKRLKPALDIVPLNQRISPSPHERDMRNNDRAQGSMLVLKLTANGLRLGEGGDFHHKCWCGEPMFDDPQNCLRSTEPPLLPNRCYRLVLHFHTL